jgi:hypothetical protein
MKFCLSYADLIAKCMRDRLVNAACGFFRTGYTPLLFKKRSEGLKMDCWKLKCITFSGGLHLVLTGIIFFPPVWTQTETNNEKACAYQKEY